MESLETVVVGAGVVGLAVARALASSGREVVILEAENMIGTGTSSRNSEVIHAGIYYEPGSLKARLCVEGRQKLYPYCEQRGVPHRKCGKLIVATAAADEQGLERIARRAEAAGVDELRGLAGHEARALEPALQCTSALLSPETGIIDSHGLMLAYLGEAEDNGATLAVRSKVTAIRRGIEGFELEVDADGERIEIACREFVNAAGLGAVALASVLEGFPAAHLPTLYLAKGNYFALTGRCPFSRLIYPIPNEAGLGVHLTIDLGGQGRFGPDVEWIETVDYGVRADRGESFYQQIRTYWPGLPDGSLHPSYSGIRPKLVPDGFPAADFRIDGPAEHGVEGLVNLFGIESPGLTASLAIAELVLAKLEEAR
jgi:L-2-hydroxyglutarate oxidase LhgO